MRRGARPLIGLSISAATVAALLAGLYGLDAYAHQRFAAVAGWNVHGYRGSVLGPKTPNEVRIAALGGSTTYGYGVGPGQSYPAQLERALADALGPRVRVTVANLGFNNDGAVCFKETVEAYAYLDPDIYVIYSGVNDSPQMSIRRRPSDCGRPSWVFRTFGHLPIVHVVLREKYYQLRYGSVEKGYLANAPKLATVLANWREELQKSWQPPPRRAPAAGTGPSGGNPTGATPGLYGDEEVTSLYGAMVYKDLVVDLVRSLLNRGKGVLVAPEPFFADERSGRRYQQALLRAALEREFGGNARFRYVDLGNLFTREEQLTLTSDGMHLTPEGNTRLARALVEPVAALARPLAVARVEGDAK